MDNDDLDKAVENCTRLISSIPLENRHIPDSAQDKLQIILNGLAISIGSTTNPSLLILAMSGAINGAYILGRQDGQAKQPIQWAVAPEVENDKG